MKYVWVAIMVLGLAVPAYGDGSPIAISKTFIVTTNQNSVTWVTCLNFTNMDSRTVQAIQFKFTYKDAFDEAVGRFKADRVGEFGPGILIEGPDNESDYMTSVVRPILATAS